MLRLLVYLQSTFDIFISMLIFLLYCYFSDVGYDEKRVDLIRRIDFAFALEREDPNKKQKKTSTASKESQTTTGNQPWPWQTLVENLQLAHQELSVIIDLINTVRFRHTDFCFRNSFTCILSTASVLRSEYNKELTCIAE